MCEITVTQSFVREAFASLASASKCSRINDSHSSLTLSCKYTILLSRHRGPDSSGMVQHMIAAPSSVTITTTVCS